MKRMSMCVWGTAAMQPSAGAAKPRVNYSFIVKNTIFVQCSSRESYHGFQNKEKVIWPIPSAGPTSRF